MNPFHRSLIRLLTVFAGVLPLPACALSGGAIEGQVLEEGTNKPVAQAVVIVKWVGSVSKFVDSQSVCVHVESAITDNEGRYRTPAWSAPSTVGPEILVSRLTPVFTAYKPATRQVEKETDFPLYLKPFTGGRGERIKYLSRLSGVARCGESGASEKNLLLLKRVLYEEAKTIAVTAEDHDKVETLLFGLESLEFGSMEALNRMTERRKVKK